MWAFGLKLLFGGLGRLRSAIASAWGWTTKNPVAALCVVLAATTVWFWRGNVSKDRQIANMTAERVKLVTSFKQAQADAKAAQDRQDRANVTTQTARNDRLETDYAAIDSARRSAVADYILRHPAKTCRSASSASQAGVHPDTAEPVDSAETTGLVTIAPAELDALAAGSVHGAKCTGFLNALIAEGLAIPAP